MAGLAEIKLLFEITRAVENMAKSVESIAESLHKLANPLMKINADTGEATIVKEDQPT